MIWRSSGRKKITYNAGEVTRARKATSASISWYIEGSGGSACRIIMSTDSTAIITVIRDMKSSQGDLYELGDRPTPFAMDSGKPD